MGAMKLHVVTCISNPVRFASRYKLYRDFAAHMAAAGADLLTVELAYGDRPHEITQGGNPKHVQLRTHAELWHKENLINLGVARLPNDWEYVAWIDADVHFVRPDWIAETVHQLQHHAIVQMFSDAFDLGPDGHVLADSGRPRRFGSFASSVAKGVSRAKTKGYYGGATMPNVAGYAYSHHPGFAWAMRRDAWDKVGGLFDQAVVGEADWIMARSIVGECAEVLYPGLSAGYAGAVRQWQMKAVKELRENIGCVQGTLMHGWHGKKVNRLYWDRCKILRDTQFDPHTDLKRDWQGVYDLVDNGSRKFIQLRDALRGYFRQRNEDSIDV